MNNGIRESYQSTRMLPHSLEDLLSCATRFSISDNVKIEFRGNKMWVVTVEGHWVLNKEGKTEYEPSPSNRTKDFIERTRFDFTTAWKLATSAEISLKLRSISKSK